jgi:hypothetical protein
MERGGKTILTGRGGGGGDVYTESTSALTKKKTWFYRGA